MPTEKKTNDDIQRELLEAQLESAKIQLEQAKDDNARYKARKLVAQMTNANRQAQFRADRRSQRALERVCRHKSGGSPGNILKGGGRFSFSLLSRSVMPDGKTELIQCSRCRLKRYGRERTPQEEARLQADAVKAQEQRASSKPVDTELSPAEQKWLDHTEWKELREESLENGLEHNVIRGVTFMFEKDGVNFIPELV